MRRTLVVVGAALLLAGCGGDKKDAEGYPVEARKTFVSTCTGVITGQQKKVQAERQCACAFVKIEGLIPYARYKKLEAALSKGDTLDPKLEKTLRDAIAACDPT